MTRAEAFLRYQVAMKRLADLDPTASTVTVGMQLATWATRAVVHLCIGFGGASLAHLSAWWGVPMAVLSAQTLGRLWVRAWRDAEVRRLEAVVAQAEAARAKRNES